TLGDDRAEIASFKVLHHHEGCAIVELAYIPDACDVLALDLYSGARFAKETRRCVRMLRVRRKQKFDGHAFVQAEASGLDDDTHAPLANYPLYAVLAGQDVADRSAYHLGRGWRRGHRPIFARRHCPAQAYATHWPRQGASSSRRGHTAVRVLVSCRL